LMHRNKLAWFKTGQDHFNSFIFGQDNRVEPLLGKTTAAGRKLVLSL
jgi:hypothetical protein